MVAVSANKEKRTYKVIVYFNDFKEETFEKAIGVEVDPYTFKIRDKDLGLHYFNRQFCKKLVMWEHKPYRGPMDEENAREAKGIQDEEMFYAKEDERAREREQRYSS